MLNGSWIPNYRTVQNEQVVANPSLGKAYLHLKLSLAKSYKQEDASNYTHSFMET